MEFESSLKAIFISKAFELSDPSSSYEGDSAIIIRADAQTGAVGMLWSGLPAACRKRQRKAPPQSSCTRTAAALCLEQVKGIEPRNKFI